MKIEHAYTCIWAKEGAKVPISTWAQGKSSDAYLYYLPQSKT